MLRSSFVLIALSFVLVGGGQLAARAEAPAAVTASGSAASSTAEPIEVGPADWPWWRGPDRNGIAPADPTLPTAWSETENVLWKVSVPGRGHGSPTVVGDRVFLAVAEVDRELQGLICYDRRTGEQLWRTDVHRGPLETKGNGKSTQASATPACDGRRVFINFLHDGAVHLTALSIDGKQLWQSKVADFVMHQGFGASPALYESLVIASADSKGGGAIAAFDRATGATVWKVERPALANYTSPIILHTAGRDQLLLTGCDLVTSLDPRTGTKLWEIAGATTECVTSTVTDGERIITTGGYPKNHVAAVAADGSGKVVWESATRVYVPSLVAQGEHLYGVLDAGIAACWETATGREVWKQRIGGTFSASPVLVGSHLYAVDEAGKTTVFKASPAGFELVGENQLGDETFATPTICGGRIYLRAAATTDGVRQETLYCLGKAD